MEVEHDFIRVDPDYRDRGWASALETHLMDGYRDIGVDKITLTAALVGSYAWAMQGYRFEDDKEQWWPQLQKIAHQDKDGPAATVRDLWGDEVLRELEDFIASEATAEWQIASWGREHAREVEGHMTWPGKAYLIGNGWAAVKNVG